MRHSFKRYVPAAGALLLAIGWPMTSAASLQLAGEYGCYNCHGAYLHGDAPSFEELAGRLAQYKGNGAEEQKYVDKFLADGLHIVAHEQLTPESAKTLIHWLIEGAK